MKRNITFSAEQFLIQKARFMALKKHTTLNEEFRKWLSLYTSEKDDRKGYGELMQKLSYAYTTEKFSRDELNER